MINLPGGTSHGAGRQPRGSPVSNPQRRPAEWPHWPGAAMARGDGRMCDPPRIFRNDRVMAIGPVLVGNNTSVALHPRRGLAVCPPSVNRAAMFDLPKGRSPPSSSLSAT